MNFPDRPLEAAGAEAYVLYSSSDDPDMRYLTGFETGDPVFYIKKKGRKGTLVVPQMEAERAVSESHCDVVTRGDAGFFDYLKEEKDPAKATAKMVAALAGGDILVPRTFPLYLAREMERLCKINIDKGTVSGMRAVKTPDEADFIRHSQKITEDAISFAVSLIKSASAKTGELEINETPLTSDYLRNEIHCYLLKRGLLARDTIVSCGPETSMPHCKGSGVLVENEPIMIDLFPQDTKTGYYADMTRTFVRGEPDGEIKNMFSVVREAKVLGKSMIREGVSGSAVHNAVVSHFEGSGYKTGTEGFIHSLGHGVGMAVHEEPSLSPSGKELLAGNVVTVEPGLYYRSTGGIRLEDMGLVLKEGFDCFTKYKDELII
ncbi:aminopeptidase P family protein [Methanoplanus sp. FWC-SCC4]|uniref:Aminopeptidase P family protein n=1 Tax=Methanochimaera problematica TaxID=2609417 RepID=A0AA97I3G7_9EURY|nr:Xaa-Pro peptidase family protein [Methanoplanus sp. FWC-SCC4]WOF16693.1 aminopeptidase P family protein [Methanoplanus sp. FWC-SCC4]